MATVQSGGHGAGILAGGGLAPLICRLMSRPSIITLWIAVLLFSGWLFAEGETLEACGAIGAALTWEFVHWIERRPD